MNGTQYLDGQRVIGMYLDEIPVAGVVELSRVKFGGGMSHHIKLDKSVTVYGSVRERVILDENEIKAIL